MNQSRAFVRQRRESILAALRQTGRANVTALATALDVSPLTVRRDLDRLEQQGLLCRRYGEAILASENPELGDGRRNRAIGAIAAAGAELVRDHEVLFINTSLTALSVIEHIGAEDVTIVTNSARAQSLTPPASATVLVTGGEIRSPRGVLSGEFALSNVRSVSATTCFIGCAGISTATGVTSTAQQEATVNSLMVERSDRMVLLADSSKIGAEAGFTYAGLAQVSLLITDELASDEDVERLIEAGVGDVRRVGLPSTDRLI